MFGLLGLALLVFVVARVAARPGLGRAAATAPPTRPSPREETPFTYAYYAIALFGAAMTPYEVFFFSSGAVEDEVGPTRTSALNRANVYHRLPARRAAVARDHGRAPPRVCAPSAIAVEHAAQVALPVALALGQDRPGRRSSSASSPPPSAPRSRRRCRPATRVAQYFGWQWGKYVRPREAAPVPRRGADRRSCAACCSRSAASTRQGHRVLDRAVGRRPAADLLPDPRRSPTTPTTWASTSTAGSSTRIGFVYLRDPRASSPWRRSR